jgi:hypothetical protein
MYLSSRLSMCPLSSSHLAFSSSLSYCQE